ncbi:MAG TPA: Glu/Leu/Phe/Val dehydrogenase dimerization domain-containing protein [Micavibrio sp.]
MDIFDLTENDLSGFSDFDGHERVRRIRDPETGLLAFIGVHNRNLGPAMGGCRMVAYESEEAAIRDVLRLSRGMTYKNALAGLPLGGGKSVIIGDPFKSKNEMLMAAMGRAVQSLKGNYITAEDSGTGEADMITMSKETDYVVGLPAAGGDLGGNPSPVTAWGVFNGLRAAVRRRYGSGSLTGLKVAVQGLGAVGYGLCRLLHKEGVELIATDIRPAMLDMAKKELPGLHVMQPDHIFGADANVFAPCALGAQLNERTIAQLKVDIVAGAANNQLATPADEDRMAQKHILYVPDYAINAGGVIAVAYEYFHRAGANPFSHDLTRETMMEHVERIDQTINDIFELAETRHITTGRAADQLARSIFKEDEKASAAG